MKFFRRADEMEMSINFKAMRLAYVFENAALLVWAVISQIKGYSPIIQTTIILIQNIIFFGSQLYMKRKMAKEKKDKHENKIKVLRKELGLRQEDVANRVGVTRQTIIAIENDRYDPTLELAMKLAQLLNTPVEEIFQLDK